MQIQNIRKIFTLNSTIGELSIDGVPADIFIMEPCDLGLDDSLTLPAIIQAKADHFTKTKEYVAIPTGKAYRLTMYAPPASFMARFPLFVNNKITEIPLFTGIKGYGGVFIHPGIIEIASHQQSEGCQMPALGVGTAPDTTVQSNEGWMSFMEKCGAAIKSGTATYEPVRDADAWNAFKTTLNQ